MIRAGFSALPSDGETDVFGVGLRCPRHRSSRRLLTSLRTIFPFLVDVPIAFLPSQYRLLTALLTLCLVGSLVPVDADAQDAPQSWTAEDPELEWGPCPAFMPETCAIAVLQGAPDAPNADIFFKMASNTTVPLHRHTSPERMVLVSGEMHVTYEGHDPVVLRPGTYAHGPAELPHDAYCADDPECVLFIAFEEPVDAIPAEQ